MISDNNKEILMTNTAHDALNRRGWWIAIILVCVLLAAMTVLHQVQRLGFDFLYGGLQWDLHCGVIEGRAADPWQYRVLMPWLIEGLLWTGRLLGVDLNHNVLFVFTRCLQNLAIFILAIGYYRALGLNLGLVLIGVSILAWSMTHSLYDSDLQFGTYSDVAFYLAAGWLIVRGHDKWVLLLIVPAALNRETSGLIPLLLASAAFFPPTGASPQRKILILSAMGLVLFIAVFFGLRLAMGPRLLFLPHDIRPGWDLLCYNLWHPKLIDLTLSTMGAMPLLALLAWRRWPAVLRAFFWVIVPIWLIVHLTLAVLVETRLLLVPQALIFIPGALCLADRWNVDVNSDHSHA